MVLFSGICVLMINGTLIYHSCIHYNKSTESFLQEQKMVILASACEL